VADLETEVPRLLESLWLVSLVEMLVVVDEEPGEEDVKEDAVQPMAKEAFEALEQAEPAFALALIDVPRDFLVGGSSRERSAFIELRLP